MWYLVWIAGLGLTVAAAIAFSLWLEKQEGERN